MMGNRRLQYIDSPENLTVQSPVFQSIVSLTSSLVVKMLTVLVSTISNSQAIFAENAKASHIFFSKNIGVNAVLND